jgi:hypothetical protein
MSTATGRAAAVRRSDRWIDATELARATGTPASSVRRWCATGRVTARRRGLRAWQVDLDELKIGEPWERALYRELTIFRNAAREGRNPAVEGG